MKILLVEDDEALADGLSHSLADGGFDVTLAMTGTYADHALRTQLYDLAILDLGLPDTDGREMLRALRARQCPVLIRRSQGSFGQGLKVGRFTLDNLSHQVSLDGEPLLLPLREFEVL